MVHDQADRQGDGSDDQILRGTEIIGITAAEGPCSDRKQRKTDSGDDGGGHDGLDVFHQMPGKQAQCPFHDSADQYGSQHGGVSLLRGNGAQNRDECEAYTHYDGQPGSDPPYRIELDQGGDTGDEHGILEKHADLVLRKSRLGSRSDDRDRRQVGDEHRKNVLQSEGNRLPDRDSAVKAVNIIDAYLFERLSFL